MKKINIEGIGTLSFPDAASDDQIAAFINSTAPTELKKIASTQAPDTLGRQIGLSTRPMAQTALTAGGMLPMVVDPMVNLFNLATGSNLPTQTQAVEKTLSAVGFPQTRTPQERIIQDVATAGYGVGGVTRAASEIAPKLPGMASELAKFFV